MLLVVLLVLLRMMLLLILHLVCFPGRMLPLLQGGETASLQEFGNLFNDVKFRKGLQLNFTSASNGHLIAQIDDRQVRLNSSAGRQTLRTQGV